MLIQFGKTSRETVGGALGDRPPGSHRAGVRDSGIRSAAVSIPPDTSWLNSRGLGVDHGFFIQAALEVAAVTVALLFIGVTGFAIGASVVLLSFDLI